MTNPHLREARRIYMDELRRSLENKPKPPCEDIGGTTWGPPPFGWWKEFGWYQQPLIHRLMFFWRKPK